MFTAERADEVKSWNPDWPLYRRALAVNTYVAVQWIKASVKKKMLCGTLSCCHLTTAENVAGSNIFI